MKKLLIVAAVISTLGIAQIVQAGPKDDLKAFQSYYKSRFPDTKFADFQNGVYAIDAESRAQWESIEEFPPYEPDIETGKQLFNTPFKNGKTYASCFKNDGIGVAQNYPYFDSKAGKVVTLDLAINECRTSNGEEALDFKKGKLAQISAYMAYTSRGKKIDIEIPDDPKALAAYEAGKTYYYAKRGQLNMSCADCHVNNAGNRIRADILSPALGHTTHFPVYRSTWGEIGTLHWRFIGCNEQVRAKASKAQSEEYRNLEYFLTYMGNGLEINGPGFRK